MQPSATLAATAYQQDRTWSDRFLPQLKQIIAKNLIGPAPAEEDMRHNTDLIVIGLEALRVACRVRRHKYLDRYHGEFTIRSDRPNGMPTELQKILGGWGDYILYAICTRDEAGLAVYVLGDLKVFRIWFFRYMATHRGELPGLEQPNGDDSSKFRAFRIDDLPPEFIKDRKSLKPDDAELDRFDLPF